MWALHVQIFEQAVPGYPVVEHIFFGKTQQEAQHVANAHAKADKFFAGCTQKGDYQGITCRYESFWRQF
jgi:hypothetical protein